MRIIMLASVALPLLAATQLAGAQMKCPDGSYRDVCSSGQGEAFEGGNISTYDGPAAPELPPLRFTTPRSSGGGGAPTASQPPRREAPPQGLMSLNQRARDMGVSRQQLMRARNAGTILRRMHKRDVEYILGKPDVTNVEQIGGQRCEHLHWRKRYTWTHYVRLCNGRVDVIRENNV